VGGGKAFLSDLGFGEARLWVAGFRAQAKMKIWQWPLCIFLAFHCQMYIANAAFFIFIPPVSDFDIRI
jgi:hypothetical protein